MTKIPDKIKRYSLDLQNIVGLLYTGYPPDDQRYTQVSTRQLQRLIHLEKSLRKYLMKQLGPFWEGKYLQNKGRKNK